MTASFKQARFSASGRYDLEALNGDHWPSTLRVLGVPEQFLKAKNKPCPFCGGRDRYSFTNAFGRGDSFCRHCGYNSGIRLAMHFTGMTFREAYIAIAKQIGMNVSNLISEVSAPRRVKPLIKDAEAVWNEGKELSPETPAWTYLLHRGLVPAEGVRDLRFHPDLAYYRKDEEGRFSCEKHPALLGAITNSKGKIIGLQRIYLSRHGKAEVPNPKKILGKGIAGNCVRLFDWDETQPLGIAEGIETAIAASKLFGIPVWSVLSAGNLSRFHLPAGLKKLVIFGDNDRNFVGQKEAYKAANVFRSLSPSLEIAVRLPEAPDSDWNDVLLQRNP